MDIRKISDTYSVSPQITPDEVAEIAEAGFVRIICNRPDAENPAFLQAAEVEKAAVAAGLSFSVLPLTHQTMTMENATAHKGLIEDAGGPVLAYCASGTRSTIVWALGQRGSMAPDAIISAAADAGYDLSGMRQILTV